MLSDNEIFLLQLHKLSSEIIQGSNLKTSLRRVLESARKLLHFNRVYLFVKDPHKEIIEVRMAVGKHSFIAKSLKWPAESMGGPTYAFATGRPFIQHGLQDPRIQKYYPKKPEDKDVLLSIYALGKFGSGDIGLVPVTFRNRTIAVLGADRLNQKLSPEDKQHLEEFASQIGWAIENARLREENQTMMKELEALVDKRSKELKELQVQLIHSERLAAMGELVAGITHEIKNPLTGIVGFTELLSLQPQDESNKQIISGLKTSVTHLQDVVKNFLSFSKKTKPTFAELDINQTIVNALALTSYNIRRRNIVVERKLAADLPQIKGDASQLIQVFTNMFMNAEQAMPNGGTLTITSKKTATAVIVSIADTGIGISPENLKKLFTPFFTTKGEDKGTGLGLSVSQTIIKNHHGKIKVVSTLGQGTTFTLSFPRVLK
jgi:signal transduction histidine kinase